MKEWNPLEGLLGSAGNLLKVIQLHQGPISKNLSPQIMQDLEKLELSMAQFEEINKQTFKNANIDIEGLKRETLGSGKITPKQNQLLKQAQDMEQEARNLKMQYEQVVALTAKAKPVSKESDARRRDIKNRRKRYKPLGGDKDWIPI